MLGRKRKNEQPQEIAAAATAQLCRTYPLEKIMALQKALERGFMLDKEEEQVERSRFAADSQG